MNANNIYVGNRYTPLFCGPWEEGTEYESLSAVTYTDGNAYVSKKPVPAGTLPTDPDYWVLWGSGNAALDSVTKRLNTVENDVENLENSVAQVKEDMPWKVSTTLKGDGKTDNTLLFGALDPDTPISLTPGTYLITGNVTIPCAIQFIPGAVIKYNAATPGTNYATVTFAKGFYVPDNTQIFDTYIIPKIGGNNTSVNPKFSWFGGKESNDAQTNDNIITWLLSSTFLCRELTIEPGSYSFTDMSQGQYFNSVSTIRTKIRGYGVKITTPVKTAKITHEGIDFTESVETNENTIFENCSFTAFYDGTVTAGNNTSFTNCYFNTPITSLSGNLIINGGRFSSPSKTLISTMGENGKTTVKNMFFDLGGYKTPFSFSDGNINVLENILFNMTGKDFNIQMGKTSPNVISNCVCTNGNLICNTAINNICLSLDAQNRFGNTVNGQPDSGQESIEQLTKDVEDLKQQASGFNGTLALLLKRDYPSNISKSGNFLTIQFNSGLQFVFFKLEISDVSLGTAIGSMYRNASRLFDPSDYGYPIPFYEDPMYTGLVFDSTNYQGALPVSDTHAGDRKSNVPGVQLLAPTSRTVSGYIEILTVGLYKSMPLG